MTLVKPQVSAQRCPITYWYLLYAHMLAIGEFTWCISSPSHLGVKKC